MGPTGSKAEVHQQDAAAIFAHHVFSLDIAMEQTGAMHRAQGAANINSQPAAVATTQGGPCDATSAARVLPLTKSVQKWTRPSWRSMP